MRVRDTPLQATTATTIFINDYHQSDLYYSIKLVDKDSISILFGQLISVTIYFFWFFSSFDITFAPVLIIVTYRERLRDWPIEALTTYFIVLLLQYGKRCQFHFRPGGADKSDEKLITLKLVIRSKLFPLLPEGLFCLLLPENDLIRPIALSRRVLYTELVLFAVDAVVWNNGPYDWRMQANTTVCAWIYSWN